jgi:hypothetical protein
VLIAWGDSEFVLEVPDQLGPRWPPSIVVTVREFRDESAALAGGEVIQQTEVLIDDAGGAGDALLQ